MDSDPIISVFAVSFHPLMIVGALLAYLHLSNKSWADLGGRLITLVAQTVYFASIIALLQPRYLSQFARILHPDAL